MKLGFVSAILPDLELEEVLAFANAEGFSCVELMCWPKGKAERRYAGVTHVDVATLDERGANRVRRLLDEHGVSISGLGYYPNPLAPDPAEAQVYVEHLKAVIGAAPLLGVNLVNTFVGRDWTKTVDAQWPRFLETWRPLVAYAEQHEVRIGIENCPMLFTGDEWPGEEPRHEPGDLAAHVRRHPEPELRPQLRPVALRLAAHGLPGSPSGSSRRGSSTFTRRTCGWTREARRRRHPGDAARVPQPEAAGARRGRLGRFFSVLSDTGYAGPVCVEVEDRACEGSLETRRRACGGPWGTCGTSPDGEADEGPVLN